ncbi:MAG: potassium channel protein [Candidatus Latescibacteria bacterium]|jgi:voltage-gated potassium channel|nr:potassium channel protein [Candidatus Latescibacterota bacterium]
MKIFKNDEIRIIVLTAFVGFGIISFGVIGYMVVEGWNFFDSLYQTVITISTVGFTEIHTISQPGRIITIFLILLAISLLTYFFSQFVTIMVEGRLNKLLRGRKMEKKISRLKDHFIICGYGKMGNQITFEFQNAKVPFVVLDKDPEVFERESATDILWLTGDASREEDLERCNIKKARGLVSVLTEDQDNVYTILTARVLNSNLRIVTRSTEYESERKLKRAGADHVISPFKIGGSRIASVMLRPSITHFLDGLSRAEEIRLTLIEIEIMENSLLEGKTIRETGIIDISESIIVGLRRKTQPMMIRPSINTELKVGDQLVLMGQLDALHQVEKLIELS